MTYTFTIAEAAGYVIIKKEAFIWLVNEYLRTNPADRLNIEENPEFAVNALHLCDHAVGACNGDCLIIKGRA